MSIYSPNTSPSSYFVIFIFSTSPYCPLCASSAITTILFRSDSGSSDSSNFCIVVKIIPFACLPASKVFRFSRLSACIGSCLKKSLHHRKRFTTSLCMPENTAFTVSNSSVLCRFNRFSYRKILMIPGKNFKGINPLI